MTIPPFAVFMLCTMVAVTILVVMAVYENRDPDDDDEEGLA